MYYILTYDIADPKRLQKALKICRKYLKWISRSVFEGNMSRTAHNNLMTELDALIDYEKDSIILFSIRNESVCKKDVYGKQDFTDKYFV